MIEEPVEIYNKSLDILSRREHSKKEILDKLSKKFSNLDLIELTIQKLEDNNLINDARFFRTLCCCPKKERVWP